jgi:nucleoside-diphosphate-sugar epimerase
MKIALTGASGGLGRAIAAAALARGHKIVGLDLRRHPDWPDRDGYRFVETDVRAYDAVFAAFERCDALIHMAAHPAPTGRTDHVVHNDNVVGSYNVMRAAIERGIERICQASSVNAIGLSFSREPHFEYLPIDEKHPTSVEEPYSLSKWICEQQADAFARRYDGVRIASMRFHWVVPNRTTSAARFGFRTREAAKHLWAYTLFEPAARACLMALEADFKGHQAFYITAPETNIDAPSLDLAREFFPQLPIRGDLSGRRSFFDCAKAERLLGWTHGPG